MSYRRTLSFLSLSILTSLLFVEALLLEDPFDPDDPHEAHPNSGRIDLSLADTHRSIMKMLEDERRYPRLDNRPRFDEYLRPARSRCDRRIRVLNGATRIRDKGALVRFQCSFGYHMLGAGVAVCVRGKWSDPPPVCVRDGCKALMIPVQGTIRQLYGGGVAMFTCNYGYVLEGERILTCDGQKWNGTAPECVEIPPVTLSPPSTTFPTIPLEIATPESEPKSENKTASVLYPEQGFSTIRNVNPTETETEFPVQSSTQVESGIEVPSSTESVTDRNEEESSSSAPGSTTDESTVIGTTAGAKQDVPTEATTEPSTSTARIIEIPTTATTRFAPVPTAQKEPAVIPTVPVPETTKASTSPAETAIHTTAIPTPRSPTTPSSTESTTILTTTSVPVARGTVKTAATSTTITYSTPTRRTTKMTTERSTTIKASDDAPTRHEMIALTPHKLDTGHDSSDHYNFAHLLIVAGTVLVTIGFVSILGGVLMYCWRKNKGIARATGNDMDGRTLSYDGNDELIWLDGRDNGL